MKISKSRNDIKKEEYIRPIAKHEVRQAQQKKTENAEELVKISQSLHKNLKILSKSHNFLNILKQESKKSRCWWSKKEEKESQ